MLPHILCKQVIHGENLLKIIYMVFHLKTIIRN